MPFKYSQTLGDSIIFQFPEPQIVNESITANKIDVSNRSRHFKHAVQVFSNDYAGSLKVCKVAKVQSNHQMPANDFLYSPKEKSMTL